MNATCSILLLAANRLNDASKKGSDFNFYWIIFAVLIVIAVVVAYFAFDRFRKIRANSHYSLFRDLCRLHGLDSNSKDLLCNIAQYYQIEKPVRLFLEPNWLDQARLRNDFSSDAELINGLRMKLFG
jgi:hypothetical protein